MARLFVGNLPNDAREEDLRRVFSDKAQIRDLTLRNGFAFVVRGRREKGGFVWSLACILGLCLVI